MLVFVLPYTQKVSCFDQLMSTEKCLCGQYPEALLIPLHNCIGHQGVDRSSCPLLMEFFFFFLINYQCFAVTKLEFTTSWNFGLFIWGRDSYKWISGPKVKCFRFRKKKANFSIIEHFYQLEQSCTFKKDLLLFISNYVCVGERYVCIFTYRCPPNLDEALSKP